MERGRRYKGSGKPVVITTTDRLFQFREMDENADPATREALRYSQALLEGYQSLRDRPLTTRTASPARACIWITGTTKEGERIRTSGLAEQICGHIKGTEMRVRRVPETALARGGAVVYTPPVGEDLLRSLLGNWERFLHDARDIDPLIRMAVGHYQFEAIHPFTDGNGRTGRVLNSLFLHQRRVVDSPNPVPQPVYHSP